MYQVALGRGLIQVGGTAVVRLGPRGLERNPGRQGVCSLSKAPFLGEEGVGEERSPLRRATRSSSPPSPSLPLPPLKMVSGSGVQVIFAHGHSLQLVFWVVFGINYCSFFRKIACGLAVFAPAHET